MLRKDPLRERVQGADGGAVELPDRDLAPHNLVGGGGGVGDSVLELLAHLVAQLSARLLGEGDGRDVAELHAGFDEGDHATHEGRGLARSGPGLNEQGCVERSGDGFASRLVGREGRGHAAPSSSSASVGSASSA